MENTGTTPSVTIAPKTLPYQPACVESAPRMPEPVDLGYIRINLGAATVSIDVTRDLAQVSADLAWCVGKAKAVLRALGEEEGEARV